MSPDSDTWRAIETARVRDVPRVPFHVDGQVVGSVAQAHLEALRPWSAAGLRVDTYGVHLDVAAPGREALLAQVNQALREQGLIRAWRDEPFPLFAADGQTVLANIERASARFWGTLTLGAHANGFVADADGRPAFLWVATRAADKPTDPGLRDNLIGGGVPLGQSPREALVREGWEEAGLPATRMQEARAGRVVRIDRDAPEGRMLEDVHVFDLELPPGLVPVNQDGEVAALDCLPIADAASLAAKGAMTVDAALVTLDFLLRHRLLDAASHAALERRSAGLWAQR